ncbi:MAG: HipA domain-containing protein [Deltaproteobacteria bacterium]|nr:HipA domain-containing protein [Deltaproteobacteria bacterium]
MGADVRGSVTIGEPRLPRDPIVIDETEYDRILERAAGYIRGSTVGGGGCSATGVQPKVALTWDPRAEHWWVGRGSTPSTHLLKPVPNEHSPRVRAEAYLNDVARALGLSAHDARIEAAGERTVPQVLFTRGESDPLAMRVGGEFAPGLVTVEHLVREAEGWGMLRGRAMSVVDDTLRGLVTAVESLGERHGVSAGLPGFLLEQTGNLRRGDRAWTRPLPPAIAFS